MIPTAARLSEHPNMPSVRDLMTASVIAIDESDTIPFATAEMKWLRVRHLPVVDSIGRLIGLVCEADLRTAMSLYGTAETLPVAVVMRHPVFTVAPDAPLIDAMELMLDCKLTALPVVDRHCKLVGILTESDFVRYAYRELTGRTFLKVAGIQEQTTLVPRAAGCPDPLALTVRAHGRAR